MPRITYSIRKDGRYAKHFSINGRKYYISAKSLKELEQKYDSIYKQYHLNEQDTSNITMEEWSYIWLDKYKKYNEKKTIKNYRDIIRLHINPYLRNNETKEYKTIRYS